MSQIVDLNQMMGLQVTLSYNLFNGFKDMVLKDSANYLSESSQYSLDATKQDIVLGTKRHI